MKRRVQKLSNGGIYVLLPITVPDAAARLRPLMTSGDPNFALRGKMTKTFKSTYLNALYRVFLTLFVLELERGGNICPPRKLVETATGVRVKKSC